MGKRAANIKPSRDRRIWTASEVEQLRQLYPDTPTCDLARIFCCTERQVFSKASSLGLHKSADFLASSYSGRLKDGHGIGIGTRFVKGQTPWNKGKKGCEVGGRSTETRFAPGNVPHNHVPIGTVAKSTDGYIKIKVDEPDTWRWLHRKNWEEANGPIPKGKALIFKDGNRENCAVENLELIDRIELMRRNTIHRYPPELKQVIRLAGKLNRTIEAAREKQD